MAEGKPEEPAGSLTLTTRRRIRADAARLFEMWTQPAHLRNWWGPEGVTCSEAHVDLRVGGRYRIANRFADGKVLWISGEFESVEPPRQLVYSWRLESGPPVRERVTVRFEAQDGGTEVVVIHERIADEALRRQHAGGWEGCLAGLEKYATAV
jgi:uncharacterized protein YndB with AHSA1/START domain